VVLNYPLATSLFWDYIGAYFLTICCAYISWQVKKSIAVGEAVSNKSSAGPASGNAKGSVAKAPPMSLDPN